MCEGQAIETIETVQPHGALLVLRLPEWSVTHASESLSEIFGVEAQAVIGRPLSDLMSRYTIHRLRNVMQFVVANGEPERLMNLAMGFKRDRFDLSLYADENRGVIEIKPRQAGQKNADDAFFLLRAMRARIRNAASPVDVCLRTARQCRSLTGYDRATVFRFREDGTSEIVADERRHGTSELGFVYGVEDTEMLARSLVKGACFTYVPDTHYAPSPVVPEPAPLGELRGLKALGLRGISSAQADYLHRSGVGAVFALPIGSIDAPWGAVVCQNAEPRFIPLGIRSALEFFTNGIALQVGLLGAVEIFGTHDAARKIRADLFADPAMDIDPGENLNGFAEALATHIQFDGVGYWDGGAFTAVGDAPSLAAVADLVAGFDEEAPAVQIYDDLGLANVGGAMAIRLARQPGQYLMLFRKAAGRIVRWGQPLLSDAGAREEVEAGYAAPWNRVEIEAAHAMRSLVLDLRLRRMDSADEKQAAALRRQETVITELNHRVKNLFALFQSLIAKTGETSRTPEDFVSALIGRVRSLALAHDQMAGNGISGIPLRSLVEAELAPYASDDSEIEIDGPDIAFSAQAFTVLALVMHELATNAAKYGALSGPGGKLSVSWSSGEEGVVRIGWRERVAAPVSMPTHRGFGSTIVERMIPFELRGEASVNYLPEGLSASFAVPAHFVEAVAEGFLSARRQPGAHQPFSSAQPLRALIVEDNMIIALQTEDMLRRLGFAAVDVAGSLQDAELLLGGETFDVAVLDVSLAGETSLPLAETLIAKGVPFFFATGYGEKGLIPDRFAHIPIVAKPYSDASLAAAMSEFFGARLTAT